MTDEEGTISATLSIDTPLSTSEEIINIRCTTVANPEITASVNNDITVQCSLYVDPAPISVSMGASTLTVNLIGLAVPTKLSQLEDDATHRLVTDAQKAIWNAKAETGDIPTALSELEEDSTHRVMTDAEKTAWNAKQTAEQVSASITAVTDPLTARVAALEDLLNGDY